MDLHAESKCICPVRGKPLTYIVLVLQVLGERGAHEHATLGRVRTEVSLAALSAGGGDSRVELHCKGVAIDTEAQRGQR